MPPDRNAPMDSAYQTKDFLLAKRSQGNSKPQEMVSVRSLHAIANVKGALIVVIDTIQSIN